MTAQTSSVTYMWFNISFQSNYVLLSKLTVMMSTAGSRWCNSLGALDSTNQLFICDTQSQRCQTKCLSSITRRPWVTFIIPKLVRRTNWWRPQYLSWSKNKLNWPCRQHILLYHWQIRHINVKAELWKSVLEPVQVAGSTFRDNIHTNSQFRAAKSTTPQMHVIGRKPDDPEGSQNIQRPGPGLCLVIQSQKPLPVRSRFWEGLSTHWQE